MIAVAHWLRIRVFSEEVPDSNTGEFFPDIFHAPFYPTVTVLLEYLDLAIYS